MFFVFLNNVHFFGSGFRKLMEFSSVSSWKSSILNGGMIHQAPPRNTRLGVIPLPQLGLRQGDQQGRGKKLIALSLSDDMTSWGKRDEKYSHLGIMPMIYLGICWSVIWSRSVEFTENSNSDICWFKCYFVVYNPFKTKPEWQLKMT